MIIVASLHLHVAWYVVLLLLLLFFCDRAILGRVTSREGRENRVLTAAIEEARVERGATQFRSGGKELRLPHTGTRHEHFHRREKLEGKARSSDESSSHLDESVTRSIQYSTFAKRPPSSDFYLSNSTIHHTEYFNNFSSTNLCAPKVSHLWRKFFLRIFLEKKRKIYNISLLNF